MQITFVSNYINHHQTPVSDELYKLCEGNYTFIQTEPMEEERLKMGWNEALTNRPYVKLFYEDEASCRKLIMESDVVIFGGTEKEELIIPRLEANKLTIRYSERLYKTGRWKFISPRGLIKKYHDHVRFNKSNVYLLCSGAYVAGDFRLIYAYPGKRLKYGYFPEFVEYTDVHSERRDRSFVNILWAARFIDWKHPEVMVELARRIKKENIQARISMIGSGSLLEKTMEEANDYSDIISFLGPKSPEEVREAMRQSDVFISTSDRNEGWGAVVNEAMNSGCVTIAAASIGAAPYLIENGVNGYTYRACDVDRLVELIKQIALNKDNARKIGRKAYETIKNTWNPKVAAKRIFEFAGDPKGSIDKYSKGPLSRA